MIDCPDFLDRYSDFRDQLLDPAETAEFERHLGACDSCARYDRVVANGIETLLRLPEVTPSADFADRLGDRLDDLVLQGSTGSGAPVALVIAVAATIGAAAWLPAMRGEPQLMRLPPTFAHAPYHPQLIPRVMQPALLGVPAASYTDVRYRAPGFAAYSLLGTQNSQAPARVAQAGR